MTEKQIKEMLELMDSHNNKESNKESNKEEKDFNKN